MSHEAHSVLLSIAHPTRPGMGVCYHIKSAQMTRPTANWYMSVHSMELSGIEQRDSEHGAPAMQNQDFTTLPSPHLLLLHAQCDWTTGVPDNGNEWRKFRTVPSLAPLVSPCCVLCSKGVATEGPLDFQGKAGINSIVRWNLRPVIFGVHLPEKSLRSQFCLFAFWESLLASHFCWTKFPNKAQNLKRCLWKVHWNLPWNSPRNLWCFPGRWKSLPQKFHQIFPFSHRRFQISNQIIWCAKLWAFFSQIFGRENHMHWRVSTSQPRRWAKLTLNRR